MNGDVQYDLSTLTLNNGEKLEYFHGRIIRLQQESILSGEIFSPARLLFQYMKAFSNSDKLRDFVEPKMTYPITFLDNNGKYSVYIGGDIHVIHSYLDIIGDPTTLTTSGQRSHHFSPSYSINNDASTIQTFISDLRMIQKIICEFCGIIGHKYDA